MEQNDEISRRTDKLQAVKEAVNEANKWMASVPFLLTACPMTNTHSMIDIFSLVNIPPYEKSLYFHEKYKPSENKG